MGLNNSSHIYVANVYGWAVGESVQEAINKLEKDQYFSKPTPLQTVIVQVPLPIEANYQIKNFLPVVDDISVVETNWIFNPVA